MSEKIPKNVPEPAIEQIGEYFLVPPELAGNITLVQTPEPIVRPSRRERGREVPMEKWIEKLGKENVFGPADVEKTWGVKVEVPPIPFGVEDLERAKELGQMLVLRIDQTTPGKPLSMEAMHAILQERFTREGKGRVFNSAQGWKGVFPDYFAKEAPRAGWALVSKEIIPDSTSKNYIAQTETIIQYLKQEVFKGKELSSLYKEAVEEFELQKAELTALVASNWQEAAKRLAGLKITQLTRQEAVEGHYDLLSHYDATGERLLSNRYAWGSSISADGRLVHVGRFDTDGVGGNVWYPGVANGHVGVLFSRSV